MLSELLDDGVRRWVWISVCWCVLSSCSTVMLLAAMRVAYLLMTMGRVAWNVVSCVAVACGTATASRSPGAAVRICFPLGRRKLCWIQSGLWAGAVVVLFASRICACRFGLMEVRTASCGGSSRRELMSVWWSCDCVFC